MWRIVTATAGMPQTNVVAERVVRSVKEGGRSGLPNLASPQLGGLSLQNASVPGSYTTLNWPTIFLA